MITSLEVPVNSSNCSDAVTPGIISSKVTVPANSEILGFAYGSHSAITTCSSLFGLEITESFSTTASSENSIIEFLAI